VQEAQRAQALQQQEWARHQQQELANDQYNRARWVEAEDNRYEEWAAQNSTPEERIAIQQEALNIIRESGAKDEDIAAEWHSGRSPLRSSWAQKALHDAARWRLAQKSIASKVARPVPTVQRPGAGGERATATEYQFKTLSEKIGRTSGREQLKAAAEYVSARRNARR
jgi:hypothetical protein